MKLGAPNLSKTSLEQDKKHLAGSYWRNRGVGNRLQDRWFHSEGCSLLRLGTEE